MASTKAIVRLAELVKSNAETRVDQNTADADAIEREADKLVGASEGLGKIDTDQKDLTSNKINEVKDSLDDKIDFYVSSSEAFVDSLIKNDVAGNINAIVADVEQNRADLVAQEDAYEQAMEQREADFEAEFGNEDDFVMALSSSYEVVAVTADASYNEL